MLQWEVVWELRACERSPIAAAIRGGQCFGPNPNIVFLVPSDLCREFKWY